MGDTARLEGELQEVLAEPVAALVLAVLKLAAARRSPDAWSSVMDFLLQVIGDDSEPAVRKTERKLAAYVAGLRENLGNELTNAAAVRKLIDGTVLFLSRPALLAS